jgi:phosphoglycolate phosphatase-like HAD superfamily hydrolase
MKVTSPRDPTTSRSHRVRVLGSVAFLFLMAGSVARAQDPLPSWNDGAAKRAIVDFVSCATSDGCPGYIPPGERIAVFDNDGTLWCEQPMYTQLAFALDRVKALSPQHPEWKDQEPFKSVLAGDLRAVMAGGEKAVVEIIGATHAGMTTDEFNATVRDWIAAARHPKFNRPYNKCIYQPMVEVLAYLRSQGFKTYIVSGGGIEFMRPWVEDAYGIPPEQVVGSSGKLKYELRDGVPVIVKLPEIDFIDDKAGKPVGIQKFIGQRPVIAFGNSDGDFEMLEWTTAGAKAADKPALGVIVHHTDAEREYVYDRESHVGQLARGLDVAAERGWVLIDMKADWNAIWPAE